MPSKKILAEKQAAVAALAEKMKNAAAGIVAQYQGITVEDETKLSAALREAGVEYQVRNNTITDSYAYGMLLTNIDGLKVTGNTIRNSWRLGPDDGGGKLGIRQVSGHIFVANCNNG